MLGELGAYPRRIGPGHIDLVDRHDRLDPGCPGVRDGFHGLWHDPVVGGHDKDHDVGDVGASCPKGGERFVARRVDEGDGAPVDFHLIGTDVLGDPTLLILDDAGLPDSVQQCRLAVVDMAHHGHHCGPGLEIGVDVGMLRTLPDHGRGRRRLDVDDEAVRLGDLVHELDRHLLTGADWEAAQQQGLDDVAGGHPDRFCELRYRGT